ncbi:MAG: MBL fold metallo-hydrolase [Candidatus Latescibacterota bacterium]|nr:MAG: MBL fold metallo-hydrolase [Candidatus Latescibacterota bacterium]
MGARVQFFGAVRTVTGSMHLVSNGSARLILDCGLFQGRRDESFERNSRFPFDPAGLDCCVLSHAHIDHSGNIPTLVKRGFAGRIVATEATRDLCGAMLPDSGHIQEEDVKFVNKIQAKRGLPPRSPLYTRKDAEDSLASFRGAPYRERVEIDENVSVVFYDAGHVLGSANPLVEIRNGSKTVRLAYMVDLGRKRLPFLRDPERAPEIDYVVVESTYGGRVHAPIDEAKEKLAETVRRTAERRGKIIIPSFALERTQEVVYFLSELIRERRIPEIPIYVDSPLAVNVTEIFKRHEECFDAETIARIRRNDDPFGTERISYITDVADSMKLNDEKRPMVIISASGMCEAGRILHHLRNNIENSRNTVLMVGYSAKNTLGRRIVEREKTVRIFGQDHELKAEVVVINAFSAHADRNELLAHLEPLRGKVKGVFVVHGDEDQSEKFVAALKERGFPVHLPTPEETVELA